MFEGGVSHAEFKCFHDRFGCLHGVLHHVVRSPGLQSQAGMGRAKRSRSLCGRRRARGCHRLGRGIRDRHVGVRADD